MRLKHYIILLIILSLFIPVTLASFTSEWGEYQDDETNRGFVHDESGHFNEGIGITYTTPNGMTYQPLAVNMSGNDELEIIIYSGNFLQLYNSQLNLIDEKNLGGTIEGQPIVFNNGTRKFAMAIVNNVLEAWTYEGAAFIDGFANNSELNNSFACDTWSGIKCENGTNFCYSLCDDGSDTYLVKMNMTDHSFINTKFSPNAVVGTPAIDDIDRDGSNEIVWNCDNGICVADVNGTGIPYLDISFSGDGILAGLGDDVSDPMLWNANRAGHVEIAINRYAAAGSNQIQVYTTAGTPFGTFPKTFTHAPPQTTAIYDMAILYTAIDGSGGEEFICANRGRNDNGVGTDVESIQCWDENGVTRVLIGNNTGATGNHRFPIVTADLNSDNIDEIIHPRAIYKADNTTLQTIALESYRIMTADIDQDGELDIIGSKAGSTKLIYSDFTNGPPTLYNNLSYGGYGNNYGYSTPVCVNGTITFSAQECGGTASCNYGNDGESDTERIVSNCGQLANGEKNPLFTTNLANGTLEAVNPTFQCYYNRTGIFNVRLYLQDNYNLNDFSQYNTQTITVNVINGQEGITCSIIEPIAPGETVPSTTTDQQAQTNEAIDDTFGILFGTGAQSDKLKLIVGLAIVITMTIWAAKEGLTSGVGLLAIALVTTVLVTFLGLLTPAILLIVLMSLILLMLFSKFISPSAGEGG